MQKLCYHLAGASLAALSIVDAAHAQSTPSAPVELASVDADTIIVTGTRRTGLKVEDSPAPIQVLGSDVLNRVGQPNLNQALTQIVPSFIAEGFSGDTGNLTLAARLRGLSPNQTLILVNGKRRHGTANLHIDPGAFQGGASPDLDLIPSAAIDHIEILQDGAAAQYGSDAIAGVINIILKSDTRGGTASVTGGSYYKGGGDTFAQTGRIALPIGDTGYFDLTAFHRFHDFSQQGGAERRLVSPDGTPLAGTPAAWQSIPGYPDLNRIIGDSRSNLTTGIYNAGYDFGGVELYSFGSYGRRVAQSYENYRLPNRVSRTVGGVTTFPFPNGFSPKEGLVENDYSVTGGIKGKLTGWNWDLSATYGRDKNRISTLDSANAALYTDTGFTPTNFYDGAFIASQFTGNLDVSRQLEVGLAKPLNIAFGGEYRRDTFEIQQGDPASIYKEGSQSYPGFQPTDAGKHSRRAWSGYVDLSVNPVEAWTVDLAGRYEHYSDFGSTKIGKITTRYDFSPAIAVRGTVSTGFRAPTLAEEYYSATNVSPTSAVVQLPPNSAAASILGFKPLKPEKSTNFSGGIVAHPAPAVTLTVDAYQVSIRNRIAATGTILGQSGATVINPQVLAAIAAHGNILDPTVSFVGTSLFTNGINTRTRGVEFAASYTSNIGVGRIDWSLTANYNRTKITKSRLSDALFNRQSRSYLETASPRYKIGFGALFTSGAFTANLRETVYGPTLAWLTPDSSNFYKSRIGVAGITDLELGYTLRKGLELSVGANNLFNKKPPITAFVPTPGSTTIISGSNVYNSPLTYSPYGINGGYYYGRVTLNF
jgi:iron complex outermembrane recepter protein